MAHIGMYNTLKVNRETDNGFYLDAGDLGEILMPAKFITPEIRESGQATVFIYSDSEDRLVATTETPLAKAGEFAFLKVISVNKTGAFLDWGLPKDLLVPFNEQKTRLAEGKKYLVHVYVDLNTRRMAASAKVDKFLDNTPPEYAHGEEVDLLIASESDIGYKAIINNKHWGVVYKNQIFRPIFPGDRLKGYINKIREDDKIDLLLEKPGYGKIDSISEEILETIVQNRGFIAVTDKTSPDVITSLFGISKKNFKKAIGNLYKLQLIVIEKDGIRLSAKKHK